MDRGIVLACLSSLALVAPPVAQAQRLIDRLQKTLEQAIPTPAEANPLPAPVAESGYLGLRADSLPPDAKGVVVVEVHVGSPADQAGLAPGDVLLNLNGEPIQSLDDLARRLAKEPPGAKLEFQIRREEKEMVHTVTLGRKGTNADPLPAPRSPAAVAERVPPEASLPAGERGAASLGVSVLPVTPEARAAYRLTVRSGALIGGVAPGSAADQAGLPVGGVIVAADGRRVERPEELIDVILAHRPGDEILLSYYQGSVLFRKSVRLGMVPYDSRLPSGPTADPLGDRPVLRRLEQALDQLGRPVPESPVDDVAALRREIEELRAQVKTLEERLTALEPKPRPRVEAPPEPRPPALEDPLLQPPKNP